MRSGQDDRSKTAPARIVLSVTLSAGPAEKTSFTYQIEAGVAHPTAAAFQMEPQVKEETISFFDGKRSARTDAAARA